MKGHLLGNGFPIFGLGAFPGPWSDWAFFPNCGDCGFSRLLAGLARGFPQGLSPFFPKKGGGVVFMPPVGEMEIGGVPTPFGGPPVLPLIHPLRDRGPPKGGGNKYMGVPKMMTRHILRGGATNI